MSEIVKHHVSIQTKANSPMGAYVAHPAGSGPFPGVIVGMELFGVTDYIRDVVDRLATRGFLAVAPDFYHSVEPGLSLSYDAAGRVKGFELLNKIDRATALHDVESTLDYLKTQPSCNGRVGFLGLSVGGHIGYLAATQFDLPAVAVFYAGWLPNSDIPISRPEPTLTLTRLIAQHDNHIVFFVGGKDNLVTAEQRVEISRALSEAEVSHEMVIYPEAQHGFFCEARPSTYDVEASKDAWERTLRMFASRLGD
jgi:carboxymethylenebutenolidase